MKSVVFGDGRGSIALKKTDSKAKMLGFKSSLPLNSFVNFGR